MTDKVGTVVFDCPSFSLKTQEFYERQPQYSPLKSKVDYRDGKMSTVLTVDFEVIGNIHQQPELIKEI